jgi:signal transduction histidine kinase
MKLVNKISLWTLLISFVMLLAGGIGFKYLLDEIIIEETREALTAQCDRVTDLIDLGQIPSLPPKVEISIADKDLDISEGMRIVSKSLYPDEPEDDLEESYLEYVKTYKSNGKHYKIILRETLLDSEDLSEIIFINFLAIFLILQILNIIASRYISNRVFRGFKQNLDKLKKFNLNDELRPQFIESNISEFSELKSILDEMTEKLLADYRNLKEFTENASHELQTPLAVISAKIEELIQKSDLDSRQVSDIEIIYSTTKKLTGIIKMLTLLSKIENNQFQDICEVNLKEKINRYLDIFNELVKHKKITVNETYEENKMLDINELLADVLIKNLIDNAIKHNSIGGRIDIHMNEDSLVIANSGDYIEGIEKTIFQRFKKGRQDSSSIGLGLALVKQICDIYFFEINYEYRGQLHNFKIDFNFKNS